ncbi:MAG: HAD family hydrolase, partial [Eubacteriales bacterium]|nr:HAD family hydrolase [Eubacteriales bacterium]
FDLVMKILTELEVDKYLDLVVSGEFFERSKPDPAIYINTCKRLNVAPQDVLVIEDSTVGIRAAHDAGVEVAALIDDRYGFDRSLADHEIASILELKKLIDVS